MADQRTLRIDCKRAYDPPCAEDGYRLLVDRLWPRGIRKAEMKLDEWDRDLAPSDALRRWFNHDTEKWQTFYQNYQEELRHSLCHGRIRALLGHAENPGLTLLYAAHDSAHNNAVVLREFLLQQLAESYRPD
ncbi:hypothetical protein A11A3_15709 [Alcanivorax hongdengensis A-11-3]|uniref:Uroporphyrin-III C-methyltransferase n=1 Tax=Alcanivorax hongdengensis A-11-3 TaxID=1177179 RepID=L0W7Y1_9GAMM|nr:DUF488 family protein [Alcanivorax hongdengensis]EKF73011.1 hypothetical protein A11A3_15709 [Alcanivorax hongdengensis A-11-3]